MASCGFATLVGGACGSGASNPANVKCVVVGSCKKSIQGHLGTYRVIGDAILDCEAKLILARAGKQLGIFFVFLNNWSNLMCDSRLYLRIPIVNSLLFKRRGI